MREYVCRTYQLRVILISRLLFSVYRWSENEPSVDSRAHRSPVSFTAFRFIIDLSRRQRSWRTGPFKELEVNHTDQTRALITYNHPRR